MTAIGPMEALKATVAWSVGLDAPRVLLTEDQVPSFCATGKVVHTHMESNHSMYAGMSFDFSFNPDHQRFVADQICRYIAVQQRAQLKRETDREEYGISA